MLPDPLTISYDGNSKSLPRLSAGNGFARYGTSDGMFEIKISDYSGNGSPFSLIGISLTRRAPDPTSSDVFDPYRPIDNSVELRFGYDVSRYETVTVVPLLRSALDSFVNTAMLNRLVAGEK